MKKLVSMLCMVLAGILFTGQVAYADMGDMGFFGGISNGRKLPKTTELLLSKDKAKKATVATSFVYKETLFLSGKPVEFEGLLSVKASGSVVDTEDVGTYTVTYIVSPSDTTAPENKINRNLVYTVNWRRENNQIIKDYTVKTWTETVTIGGIGYTLDKNQSYFDISVIEDHQPGVLYYRGDISQRAVYTTAGSGTDKKSTSLESYGSTYGYSCPWSSAETHRIDSTVDAGEWQMQYQIRPSVSVNKIMQYTPNEPTAISFAGNYKEVMQNDSGASYDIYVMPKQFYDTDTTGKMDIPSNNIFEQLPAPNVNFLKGHFGEYDIQRLFAMEILDNDPKFFLPDQAMTRGQFVTAMAKAIKLPIEEQKSTARNKKTQTITLTFPDVTPENPYYPYIMAAFKKGVAVGRGAGYFHSDSSIERQEAIAVLVRTAGLKNLGLDPTPVTPFTDDAKVAAWAKQELYAAVRMGLIGPDENGAVRPTDFITKAEAAALINRFIDYMRQDLKRDYTEHIVGYSN